MRVVSCLNPQHILNPYTHEYLTVNCGKCRACRNAQAHRWIERLEHEKRCWKYCYFVTLTYSNEFLPRLYDNGSCVLVDPDDDSVRIPFEDLKFNSSRDTKYFNSRVRHNLGIPYGRVSDVQKFHKRLNKYIHDNYTQKYQNFRYFMCCELGKDTFRPHFHGLYFFNDRRISDHFKEILSKTWQVNGIAQGRFDAQIVLGSATSYVAQYINMYLDLPSIYQSGALKPWYIFSKSPTIGSLAPLGTDLSEIFFGCSPTRIQQDFKRNKFVISRIPHSVENRLFPRIPKYSEISLSLRARVYRFVGETGAFSYESFRSFVKYRYKETCFKDKFLTGSDYGKEFFQYLRWLTNDFKLDRSQYLSDESFQFVDNRLKRFYYLTSRVCSQAAVFGISVDNYVSFIDRYYNNLCSFKTKQFYELQEKYSVAHDLEDLSFMYHDPDRFLYDNELEYVPQIDETFAYQDLYCTSEKIYNDSTKTHHKNDYLDRCRDKKLSLILKDYFTYV